MGLTWAIAWSAVGLLPRWVLGYNPDAPFPIIFGVLGFVAGVTFSGLLMLIKGNRGFDQMTLPRFAVWGALGGLALSVAFAKAASLELGDALAVAATFAFASAACAAGSLALARRAEMPALPSGREDDAALQLEERDTLRLP
jgi:hypothetical protein